MFLVRLIYTSKISDKFNPDDIEKILTSARRRNSANEVTGALFFSRKYFLQCLEGSRATVNETYSRIMNDPRHVDSVLLEYQEISRREFSEWSMGYVPESAKTTSLIKTFSRSSTLDPYNMSGSSCHELLMALRSLAI